MRLLTKLPGGLTWSLEIDTELKEGCVSQLGRTRNVSKRHQPFVSLIHFLQSYKRPRANENENEYGEGVQKSNATKRTNLLSSGSTFCG